MQGPVAAATAARVGRPFVEIARLRDAASEEALRLYEMEAVDTAAEEACLRAQWISCKRPSPA